MQLTKGAIGNLINRYKAVLKKCHLMNTFGSLAVAGMLVMGGAGMAGAEVSWTKPNGETAQWTNGVVLNGTVLQGTYEGFSQGDETLAGVATVGYTTTGVSVANGTTFTSNSKTAGAAGALKLLNGIKIGDNVTFTGNKATGSAWGGGAIYIKLKNETQPSGNQSVTIGSNAKFANNQAQTWGGAIALEYGNLTIDEGAIFEGNNTLGKNDNGEEGGGAIAVWHDPSNGDPGHTHLSVTKATFKQNSTNVSGGAIYNKDGNITITGSTFEDNTANKRGGAIFNSGTLTVEGGSFTNNSAAAADGNEIAASNVGGAIYNANNANLSINGTRFEGNTAAIAGAVNNQYNSSHITAITDAVFVNNTASLSAGGALRNQGSIDSIAGTTFEGNTAGNGGALWNGAGGTITSITDTTFTGNKSTNAVVGGGAITNAGVITISATTFTGNTAAGNGGAINNVVSGGGQANIALSNTTFTGNTASAQGGAIFNAASGKLDFNGTNTFTNNTAAGKANDIYNAGTITVKDGTTTLNSGLILAAGSTTDVSGGALVINGNTTWEKGDNLGSLTVNGGALTLRKDDVLVGYNTPKKDTSLSVNSGSLYLINNSNYTATDFTAAKTALLKPTTDASFGFVGGTLVGAEDNKATDLVVSGNTIGSTTKFKEDTVLAGTEVDNNSFLQNDLTVKAEDSAEVNIDNAAVAFNKVNIETSATIDKSLTIKNNGSLTVVGGNATDQLIAANGKDLTTITVDSGKLNLGSAAMPERGAGTLGTAKITLINAGSLNASNGDYTVGDVTGTGKVTADAANIKATGGDITADTVTLKNNGLLAASKKDDTNGGNITIRNTLSGQGSVVADKTLTLTNGYTGAADDVLTLQAGESITAGANDLKQADGKLTVVAGGTIEAAGITATNVAAKKLTASGDVAVDGGTLNLTGTDVSTVDSLKLTNGTQADIKGSLTLGSGKTLTVGTGDDTAGGTTLSAKHINLAGGKLLVDPAWGLASSNVAVENLSAGGATDVVVNGDVGVGRNSYLALGTADTGWLPGVVGNYTKGVGLSETGITAALGVFKGIEIDTGKNLTVDGSKTGAEINAGWTSSGAANTAEFANNSLLVVNGADADIAAGGAAIKFADATGSTLTVSEGAKLLVTDAVAGQTYTIVGNVATSTVDGWKNNGMTSTTDMISLGNAVFDAPNNEVITAATRNDAHTVFPNLSDGMANAVNDLYTSHAGAADKPRWDYADVNSADMGVRFLSRATDNRFLGMDKNAAAESIESAARIAFAGAVPQMTKMASDAGTNAVVNRLGFADPADGAQAMDADGKIVDRNTTGFALWIAPLWQSQHGWGMDADSMDYGFNGNLGGVSLGADYTFENAIRAGITFNIGGGYAESSGGDLSSTDNRMNFWGLGAYAGWNYENFGVMADVSYTSTWNQLKQDVDSRMGMGDLEADVQATAISAGLRAEYLLQTSAMDIIPHIGVRYMSLNTWGYDVDANGGTVMEGDGFHQDIWTFPVGVTFSKDFTLDSGWSVKPSIDFSVIPAAGDIKAKQDVRFTGAPVGAELETQMMDYLTWQGGVGLELANDNMSIGVNYTLQAGQHTTGHGVFGSFRYEF